MDLEKLDASAEQAAELLSALANKNRLMILCNLLNDEMAVQPLADAVGMTQSLLPRSFEGGRRGVADALRALLRAGDPAKPRKGARGSRRVSAETAAELVGRRYRSTEALRLYLSSSSGATWPKFRQATRATPPIVLPSSVGTKKRKR